MLPAIVMARALEAVEARQSHVETEMFQSRLLSGCRRTLGLGSLCCTWQQGAGSMDGIQPVANQLCVPNLATYGHRKCETMCHIRSFVSSCPCRPGELPYASICSFGLCLRCLKDLTLTSAVDSNPRILRLIWWLTVREREHLHYLHLTICTFPIKLEIN